MRTIVDGRGCNTTPGPTGLTVEGDLTVGDVNVVKALRSLTESKMTDSSGSDALKAVGELSQKLTDLEKGLKKSLSEAQTATETAEAAQKDLKAAQEESKKLSERVKTLEADLKKLSKVSKPEST